MPPHYLHSNNIQNNCCNFLFDKAYCDLAWFSPHYLHQVPPGLKNLSNALGKLGPDGERDLNISHFGLVEFHQYTIATAVI